MSFGVEPFARIGANMTKGRKRKVRSITLSDEAQVRLDEMAKRCGLARSTMIERLVRDAEMPRKPPTIS